MKKRGLLFSSILLALVLVALPFIAACGEPTTTTTTTPAAPATPAPTPAKPIEITYSYWPPPAQTLMQRIHGVWGQELERLTKGRVTVKLIGGSVLGPPNQHLEIVLSRRADIGWIAIGHFPGVFPYSDVRFLPFLFPSGAVGGRIFWEMTEKYLLDTEFKNVKVLFTHPTSVMQLITRTKQVKTLEDLKGMKIVMDSAVHVKMTEYLGGVPVFLPEGEIFTALEKGLVEGRWRDLHGVVVWKENEITKYRTTNLAIGANHGMSIMNLDAWNALPPDVQKVIDGMRLAHSIWSGLCFDEEDIYWAQPILREYDKKVGNPEWYPLPAAEKARWVTAVEPMYDWWVKEMESKGNTQAKEVLEFVRSAGKLYTGQTPHK